jgi:potassium efflux system protein
MKALFRTLVALLLAVVAIPALAQDAGDVAARLDRATTELGLVDGALDTRLERSDREELRGRAQAVRATTLDAAQQLTGDLARIDARLAQLGPAASGEDAAIRTERAALTRQRTAIDSATKRARLLSVEAQQLIDEIQVGQAAELSQKWFGRGSSPLTPSFWSAILRAAPRDLHRIERFVTAEVQTIRAAAPGRMWPALLGLVLAMLVLGPMRMAAARAGQRLLIEGAPGRRVRRSGNALGRVVVGTLAPLLAAAALLAGLRWAGLIAPGWSAMLDQWLAAIGITGFASSTLGAVLMRGSMSRATTY